VSSRVWTAVVLAGIGTYSMRVSFLVLAHRLADVPPAVQRILRQIPPAALAAIVVPALLRPEGTFDVWQPRLLAGILAAAVAWRTRNIALTLVAGIGLVMLLEAMS
jgi:branched-subunit amino acid transport protein